MKIITWNCNGAFRNKFNSLIDLNADLYIIQECENPAETKSQSYKNWAANHLWVGDNKNKGLGIFAAENIQIEPLIWSNEYQGHSVKHFLPALINNSFQLLGVWTHQNNSPNFGYIGQLWKYIQTNKLNFNKIIIAGDLNSNAIWDKGSRWWNHSDVVRELKELDIHSLYHGHLSEAQGKESQPTFYLHKNLEKPYHIDYCFASSKYVKKVKFLEVGDYINWKHLSDHAPLIISFR